MNYVFDIGSVLIRFQPLEFLQARFNEDTAQRLYRMIFCGPEWIEMDRGTLTLQQASDRFCAAEPGLLPEILRVMDTYCEMMAVIPGMEPLLRRLHGQGEALYYLSNMPEHSAGFLLRDYPFFSLFRGGVFSYAVNCLKPESEIYAVFLARFGLEAGGCVLIDDLPANIAAAERAGMRGILFRSAQALEQDLKRLER